jgi:vacuolar-type H+-ATPase subunit H
VQEIVKENTDKLKVYINENVQQLPSILMDSIKRNPGPAALIGIGIGWLLIESTNANRQEHHYAGARQTAGGYRSFQYRSEYESPKAYAQESYYPNQYTTQDPNFYQGDQGGEKGVIGQAREKVGELGEQVRDTVQGAAHEVSHRASQLGNQVSSLESQAGEKAAHLQMATQQKVHQVGQQVQHAIENNPLAVGALVFAAGAALAMVLPPTRRESQLMGEMRDRTLDTAQQLAGDVAERVQHVVEEVKPKLEETVQKVGEEVKQTGKEAASEVKQTFKEASQTTKHEAENMLADAERKIQQEPTSSTTPYHVQP